MFKFFKTLSYNKQQKAKLKSIRKTLDLIYLESEKYIAKNEPKIMGLKDLQFLLGVTQVMWEDLIMDALGGNVVVHQVGLDNKPVPPRKLALVNNEEEKFETDDEKKGTVH